MEPNLSAGPQEVAGRLAFREEETAFLVVREADPDDWLARFDKDGGFPAREWAENMVRVFNRWCGAPRGHPRRPARGLPVTIEEAFVTSTAGGIMPVTMVDGKAVGGGKPGPVTSRLREAYWELHRDPRFATPVRYD